MSQLLFNKPHFRFSGDQGLLMEFGDTIDPLIHETVRAMTIALEHDIPDGVVELMPNYRAVVIKYDPLLTSAMQLQEQLMRIYDNLETIEVPSPKTVELPVCYGNEYGPDLEFVASSHDLSPDEVINIHSQEDYLVYMVGFTPGFPFLGGLPKILHTPRLESPRKKVVAGSVGIANGQTGVYPVESPGGWQLIGRVPLPLFSPEAENPFMISAGDKLRFKPIVRKEYLAMVKEHNEMR